MGGEGIGERGGGGGKREGEGREERERGAEKGTVEKRTLRPILANVTTRSV